LAPRLTRPGYTVAQTLAEIGEFIRGARAKGFGPDSTEDAAAAPPPLWRVTRLSEWAGRAIPERSWIMENWIPRGQCVGLYGAPGVRKTDLLLQILMAASLELPFCGIALARVPTYGLFCEDSDEEIARRAHRIAGFYGRSLEDFTDFHYASLVGFPDTEFVGFDRSGRMVSLPSYAHFQKDLAELGIGLAALDTVPDFFGGDEIKRRHVTQFLRSLDGVAMRRDCCILFSAHPSQRGISTGSLDSGSTGWEGKVRARLTLHDPEDKDDEGPPRQLSDRRVLTRAKANYAPQGEELPMVFEGGGFRAVGLSLGGAKRGPMRDLAADAKFLDLLTKVRRSGSYVNDSANHPSHYAPVVFAKHPDRGDFSKGEFDRAMRRLMAKERIRLAEGGPSYRRHPEFIIV
jgi:RecA-family ATPase